MATGIVKFFDTKKGYGFIAGEDGVDYFVHFSSIISESEYKTLSEGQEVVFDVEDGMRGPSAINVRDLNEVNL